jgi:hypothetical protein
MKTIKDAINDYKENPEDSLFENGFSGDEVQLVVRENSRKPGEPIFVREDGKVGFPTINSISVTIGATIRGRIQQEEPTYFLVEVRSIVSPSN